MKTPPQQHHSHGRQLISAFNTTRLEIMEPNPCKIFLKSLSHAWRVFVWGWERDKLL